MIRGVIRPNGYSSHIRASVVFLLEEPREFIVSPQAQRDVLDEKGKPLVLSPAGYDYMRQEFGKALVCEPIGIADLGGATERIAQLEEELREARTRAERLEAVIEARSFNEEYVRQLEEQVRQLDGDLRAARALEEQVRQLDGDLRAARARISEFEGSAATSGATRKK